MESFYTLILGFFVGIFSALFGVGGGVLIVPLLPMVTPLSSRETIATSLFCIFLVSLNNTIAFWRQKAVEWRVALRIGPLTAMGSFVSSFATRWLPVFWLKGILGTLLLIFVWRGAQSNKVKSAGNISQIKIILMGLFSGLASGISGLGSGIIVSPLLLSSKLVDHRKVTPTTNAVMVFTSLFGILSFLAWPSWRKPFIWGMVHGDIALKIIGGAWVSSFIARRFQSRIPERLRKILLLTALFLLALKVFWSAYKLSPKW